MVLTVVGGRVVGNGVFAGDGVFVQALRAV